MIAQTKDSESGYKGFLAGAMQERCMLRVILEVQRRATAGRSGHRSRATLFRAHSTNPPSPTHPYYHYSHTTSKIASIVSVRTYCRRHGFFWWRRSWTESHQAQSVCNCIFHCTAPNLPHLGVLPLSPSANSGFAVLSAALSRSIMTVRLARLLRCSQLSASLSGTHHMSATDATFQASART